MSDQKLLNLIHIFSERTEMTFFCLLLILIWVSNNAVFNARELGNPLDIFGLDV